jgi:Asp-tRNA(Asn)/Glu-tRNA(Gln) amidotransferase B subunit
MRKFILTEDDKNYILGLYNSKVILSEGGLSKFFGGTVDDIIKNYGDDAVRTLDDVFAKIYSKASNIVSKAEGTFIVSASGAEVPITTIQSLIKLVGEGKIQANQVLNYLPRNLADGTEFRSVLQQAMEKKGVQNIAKQAGKQLSQFESKFLLKNCVK